MLGVFKELGTEAFGVADFDYAPSQAINMACYPEGTKTCVNA